MNADPPYRIEIVCNSDRRGADGELIHRGVAEVLKRFHPTEATVNVAIVDEREMAQLNQTYRQTPGPTDVLAFDISDTSGAGRTVEGEIAVCLGIAREQAQANGHSTEKELTLYAVHGALHLFGLDDLAPESAAEMQRLEDEVLCAIGLGPAHRKV